MRRILLMRAAIVALVIGLITAIRLAVLSQPPVPREILVGGASLVLVFFAVLGGFGWIEARARSRAQERMRQFLADASHELRTPIAGVQASAETLLRTDLDRAGREELVLRILYDTSRAGRLVSDLLAMTRLEYGNALASEPFDLVPLAGAAVDQTRELAPGLTVALEAPEQCPLHGDPLRISQILDNLLSNARQATPAQGAITVRITNQASYVEVEVIDSGPGVAPADREKIFERFTRLPGSCSGHPDGNGMGLAIARGIAVAHKGSLSCAEPCGSGARFVLRLPLGPPGRCFIQRADTGRSRSRQEMV
jgi:signal transduction histidine kinase